VIKNLIDHLRNRTHAAIHILAKKVKVYLILKKEKDLLENDVNLYSNVSFFKVKIYTGEDQERSISFCKI
jgi:hypothetical protein